VCRTWRQVHVGTPILPHELFVIDLLLCYGKHPGGLHTLHGTCQPVSPKPVLWHTLSHYAGTSALCQMPPQAMDARGAWSCAVRRRQVVARHRGRQIYEKLVRVASRVGASPTKAVRTQ
jgi:hypothetical protein